MNNILTQTDSYKVSHWKQYPPDTRYVESYIEARWSEEFPEITSTLFFGLQPFLREICGYPFRKFDIDIMEDLMAAHGEPFNREGWEYILAKHKGNLPIEIKAVPEGSNIPLSNVLVKIRNTDPKCFWLTSYLETALLRTVWYPTTVASISKYCKKIISYWLEKTGDPAGLPFKLHDFGARGVSSGESAEIGGAAHLVNFMGTDTIEALTFVMQNYGGKVPGFSIPAAEHSTITTWGGPEEEVESFRNMLNQFGGKDKLVAVVSDSYDIYEACKTWGTTLKPHVLNTGGTLVIRPDSGDPLQVTLKVVQLLDEYFGSEVNSKGYKVLHPCVRIIQGDGIDPLTIEHILSNFTFNGYSADNIAFGMGGALLQKVNRDTFGFAMKASLINREGKWLPVYKQPKTMSAKNSKKGDLELFYNAEENKYLTLNRMEMPHHLGKNWTPMLRTVFLNGFMHNACTMEEVRERSNG